MPRLPGVVLEDKEFSLALHFRACPAFEPALEREVSELLGSEVATLRLVGGKRVGDGDTAAQWTASDPHALEVL